MAANVESMFYTRKAPWHGLGVRVEEAPESKEALIQAGLDWKVEQTDVYAASGERILGYKANIRDIDRSVLGIVGDRYKIVQNEEAFAFTDGLLGEGVKYETAGSLAGGKIVWMLAFQRNTLYLEMLLNRIWCFAILTMVQVQSVSL